MRVFLVGVGGFGVHIKLRRQIAAEFNMRTLIYSITMTIAALPTLGRAQVINPVGMTLPSFQSASLMTEASPDYTPLKSYDPSALETRPTLKAAKINAETDGTGTRGTTK